MKKNLIVLFNTLIVMGLYGCVAPPQPAPDREALTEELRQVESDFAKRVADKGIREAFTFYAAEEAAIIRNERLIAGRDSISASYAAAEGSNISLTWAPEKIDVAASGDLGYTYGKYTFIRRDSAGREQARSTGYYRTIWKRQPDGSWRYVLD